MSREVCLIVKPGFVHNDIIEDVTQTFGIPQLLKENAKFLCLSREQVLDLYREHLVKPFFEDLLDYMVSERVLVLKVSVYSIAGARELTKELRERYGVSTQRNVLHCSDSTESAARELSIFFGR